MRISKHTKRLIIYSISLILGFSFPLKAYADEAVDYEAMAEARKLLPISSNNITDWPQGPEISAQAAILMEAETGTILYAKNIDERLYPASTTKILTCTLAMENCDLDEYVTFSKEAVNSVPWDGSKIGMDAGQSITMQEALEAILVGSANEVANAVAEHVAGSMDEFVVMMNKRVEDLGLTNTHFMNANGLYDDNHYTSAYDLAIIARDFFSYEMLCKIARTPKVEFVATDTQPDTFTINSKNLLMEGKKYAYEPLVGSKTGYTDKARQTLVSCARKNGMELICVVLMEESPSQFEDTVTLFEYGFNNFTKETIEGNELSFNSDNSGFFDTKTDIFGNSTELLALNADSGIILPNEKTFNDLEMKVIYDSDNINSVARAEYYFNGNKVGYANIFLNSETTDIFDSSSSVSDQVSVSDDEEKPTPVTNLDGKSVFINLKIVFICLLVFVVLVTAVLLVLKKIQIQKRKIKKKKKAENKDRERYYRSSHHKNFKL